MTKKQIKEYYNSNLNSGDEKIVDIDVYEAYGTYVKIITISRNHIVWKNLYEIVEKSLKFLETKCLY